jgi:hypothetical protein
MTDQQSLENLRLALQSLPDVVVPEPIFRLYHDQEGYPLFYSQEDLPGNYIDIDPETFKNPPKHTRVVDGELVILKSNQPRKLRPSDAGTATHPNDVCVVVSDTEPHRKWRIRS